MRGEILHFDSAAGGGEITGDDGNRYSFVSSELKQQVPVRPGSRVDFIPVGSSAQAIFLLPDAAPQPAPAQIYRSMVPPIPAASSEPELSFTGYFFRAITSYYANFSGRARRMEYWSFVVFYSVVLFVAILGLIASTSGSRGGSGNAMPGVIIVVLVIFVLATVLPNYALTVRRLHDIGASGWWVLALMAVAAISSLIPFLGLVNLVASIVIGCINSQPYANQWGIPPKRM